MGDFHKLPAELSVKAERRTWFAGADAVCLLDWLAETNRRFLGMDVAQQLDDGKWMLLIDPILDLSEQSNNVAALAIGREFVAQHDGPGRMFEPVWEGRFK